MLEHKFKLLIVLQTLLVYPAGTQGLSKLGVATVVELRGQCKLKAPSCNRLTTSTLLLVEFVYISQLKLTPKTRGGVVWSCVCVCVCVCVCLLYSMPSMVWKSWRVACPQLAVDLTMQASEIYM